MSLHSEQFREIPATLVPPLPDSEPAHHESTGQPYAHSALGHFDVAFLNREGQTVGRHTFTFECAAQDSCEGVVYGFKDSRLCLALQESIPIALLARQGLPVFREHEDTAQLLSLPQALTTGPERLGGPYLPSAGSSTEMSILVPISVTSCSALYRGLTMVPIDEIVSHYLDGIPMDTKVVLAALRLADSLGYPLRVPLALDHGSDQSGPLCRHIFRANAEQLRRHLLSPPSDSSIAYAVRCTPAAAPRESFMRSHRLEHPSGTDILVRKGIDAVDVGAYAWDGRKLCMVLKRGLRPVLAARKLLHGEPAASTDALAYEGIAESLEGETTLGSIGLRAAQGVREEAGIEPCGTPLYVGSSFPSPRKHAERVFNYLVEVDPRRAVEAEHTVDERVDVFMVAVEELLKLCDDGTIRDPRLEINARLLARQHR